MVANLVIMRAAVGEIGGNRTVSREQVLVVSNLPPGEGREQLLAITNLVMMSDSQNDDVFIY